MPPAFKPAYLIHGDDHGRLSERRAKLRSMAESQSGVAGLEVFEGEACTGPAIANAIGAMTFAIGRRFVLADGVERWKPSEVEPVARALRDADPDELTVAFFAREEGRWKAPPELHAAVKAVGGLIDAEQLLRGKELPRWVVGQAKALGLELDPLAARALVAQVGDRQQRLLRELEKLALEHEPGASISAEEIEDAASTSSERKAWTLGDLVVAGEPAAAVRALLELLEQGEKVGGLAYQLQRRFKDAHDVAVQLEAGRSPAQVKSTLRMPGFVADRFIADVRSRDPESFRLALELLADFERDSRTPGSPDEETLGVRLITAASS